RNPADRDEGATRMNRLRRNDGQAMVMTVIFLTALIACVAFSLDVGSWYREQRAAQGTADAAALAGAQKLPLKPAEAISDAQTYADINGSGVDPGGITLRDDQAENQMDTVVVKVSRTSPGFFSKLFGIDSATVHATAAARAGVPIAVWGAAPIVVNKLNPMLANPGCPCFHAETTLPLSDVGAPGGFGLINLAPGQPNVGQNEPALQPPRLGRVPPHVVRKDAWKRLDAHRLLPERHLEGDPKQERPAHTRFRGLHHRPRQLRTPPHDLSHQKSPHRRRARAPGDVAHALLRHELQALRAAR